MMQNDLDAWVRGKTDAADRAGLDTYVTGALRRALMHARQAPFYRQYPEADGIEMFSRLPTIDAEALALHGRRMVCAGAGDISRIVSSGTSGTSGLQKRVWFSAEDQERTIDFFCAGMRRLLRPGETALLLLPGCNPGGLQDLLGRGIARFGGRPHPFGSVSDLRPAARALADSGAVCAVGAPLQLLALCQYCADNHVAHSLKTALLSMEYAPLAVRRRLAELGVETFDHYGMTEIGYGGALECARHDGMHIRENDVFFEVLDPLGRPAEGRTGEITATTLTQRATPLVRYRTGDVGRIVSTPCICGGITKRLYTLGRSPALARLDESIFAFDKTIGWQWSGAREITVQVLGERAIPPDAIAGYTLKTAPARPILRGTGKRTFPEGIRTEPYI